MPLLSGPPTLNEYSPNIHIQRHALSPNPLVVSDWELLQKPRVRRRAQPGFARVHPRLIRPNAR
eukprot:scaffold54471_cov61-Phaeocystis_antarctica.AAC.3